MTQRAPALVYLLSVLAGVGGFLFGYDTGVVSGAMAIILEDDHGLLSGLKDSNERDLWHQAIVASTIGAAAVFGLLSGIPTERLGRKVTILITSSIFCAGSIIMGLANCKEVLLVGRLVVGAAIGVASAVVPVYISEVAPMELRGTLVVSYNTLVVGGQFAATLVCGAFASTAEGWRWMLGLAGVPAIIQFLGFLWMPESPRWLLSQGRQEEARTVLTKVRQQHCDVSGEMEEILHSVRGEEGGTLAQVIVRLLTHPPTRRALAIGCILMVIQQFSGINTVMYYSATIVQMAGVGSAQSAIWITAAINGLYLAACGLGLMAVERIGRRLLVLVSLGGVFVSLVVIAVGFQLADTNSPSVIVSSPPTSCDFRLPSSPSCSSCLHLQEASSALQCGFCQDPGSSSSPGSCLLISNSSQSSSQTGMCSVHGNSSYSWYPNFCPIPASLSWTIIVGLAAYLVSFAAGIAPIPWTVNSEIYPLWGRALCTSLSTSTNWTFNLIVAMTFLSLTTGLTRYGAFYLYSGLAALGWVILLLVLPETQGRTLEQMESLFSGPPIILGRSPHSWSPITAAE